MRARKLATPKMKMGYNNHGPQTAPARRARAFTFDGVSNGQQRPQMRGNGNQHRSPRMKVMSPGRHHRAQSHGGFESWAKRRSGDGQMPRFRTVNTSNNPIHF